ncbi:MAG: class IIb bacteriocin, lactobin A/cerein 7B family [Defluviitaleaceae bacterium]|nr:class IIb bacteriocin, lactobin A/cerein 7B family [Defluviitaleaceae bacterium]
MTNNNASMFNELNEDEMMETSGGFVFMCALCIGVAIMLGVKAF